MSVDVQWFQFLPKLAVTLDVTSGSLTLVSGATLVNFADFVWGAENQISAGLWKNGTKVEDITVNSSTGALSMTAVSVATGDHIEARFIADGYVATPWKNKLLARRSLHFDVAAGNQQVTFNASNNVMPVPAWNLTFGWGTNDNLKVGFKVSGDDGANEDMTLWTRKLPPSSESSTTIDLDDTTNVQTLTSSFTKSQVTECEIEWKLASGTGTTRVEDRVRLVFTDKTAVPTYDTNFPTSGTLLLQSIDQGRAKLARP